MIGELLFAGLACLLGGGLFVAGVRRLRSGVALYRNELVPLPEIPRAEGTVEFDGQAAPTAENGSFEAPFSGADAFCCQIWVEKPLGDSGNNRDDVELDGDGHEHEEGVEGGGDWGLADSAEIRRQFAISDDGSRVRVDPTDASLDITGHMGEVALEVTSGQRLPDEARARLETLDATNGAFDGSLDRWDDEDVVRYREARLEPGSDVHVTGAEARNNPDEWGSGVAAAVGEPAADERYLISRGTESEVVRRHLIQFATGTVIGLVVLGVGIRAIQVGLGV